VRQTAALFLPPWQPLADQLVRVWAAMGIKSTIAGIPTTDRAGVLAEQLFTLGVRDLSRLSIGSVTRYTDADSRARVRGVVGAEVDWTQYRGEPTKTYYFLANDGEPIGYLGTDGGASSEADPYDSSDVGVLDLWDPAGSGHIKWIPVAIPSGSVVFTPVWASSSDVPVEVVALIGIAAGFAGFPAMIGQAVLGAQAAAAYPLAAKAIGSAALQTALTGGDIEAAARSAAASLVGAQFGNVVGSGLDSAQIGTVAAAAATAAIQGGDIEKAVTRSLITLGAQSVDDYFNTVEDYIDPGLFGDTGDWMPTFPDPDYIDPGLFGDSGDWLTLDDIGVQLDQVEINDILAINSDTLDAVDIDPSTVFTDEFGNLFLASGEYVEMSDTVYVDSIYVDEDGNIRAPDNNILIPSDEALNLTADQLSAEIARQMDENAGTVVTTAPAPPSRPAAAPPAASQTKWPSITDATKVLDSIGKLAAQLKSTVNAVRTGTYRPPAGSTSTTGTPRNTPVGVPITLPDGRVVTNNGNGTQTIRTPDGRTTTVPSSYAGATGAGGGGLLSGVSNQALLIGGAVVLVGAVLLARRR
jgi:hypothetical protein